jgi:hypothetical protein
VCAANVLQAVLLYILDSEGNFDLPLGAVSAGAGRAGIACFLSHASSYLLVAHCLVHAGMPAA